eukprot:6235085-Prymnesium_polylepis.1
MAGCRENHGRAASLGSLGWIRAPAAAGGRVSESRLWNVMERESGGAQARDRFYLHQRCPEAWGPVGGGPPSSSAGPAQHFSCGDFGSNFSPEATLDRGETTTTTPRTTQGHVGTARARTRALVGRTSSTSERAAAGGHSPSFALGRQTAGFFVGQYPSWERTWRGGVPKNTPVSDPYPGLSVGGPAE